MIKTKKLALSTAVLLCGVLLFAGCGGSGEPADSGSGNGQQTVFFGLNETVEPEGLCEMSNLYAEVLDDKAVADGWNYYYTDSDQSPAPIIEWQAVGENYTTAEVVFTAKNTSDKPQTFGDKITVQMFYQENKDADTSYYNGTVFQQNPGQVKASGEIVMWSTKPVAIAAGEPTQISFRYDIPKDVYDKVYAAATGEKTDIVETCEFHFGDGTTYVIDLTKALVLASQQQ